MLQILKTMAYSRAEDQNKMLDTILDGANKAAQTVANIRSIKEGKEPRVLMPLAKEPEIEPLTNNERNFMSPIESPKPPKSMQQTTTKIGNAMLEEHYNDLSALRKKLDRFYEAGVCGRAELNEIIIDVFNMQSKVFQNIKGD